MHLRQPTQFLQWREIRQMMLIYILWLSIILLRFNSSIGQTIRQVLPCLIEIMIPIPHQVGVGVDNLNQPLLFTLQVLHYRLKFIISTHLVQDIKL
jgi:hypothetical protein